MLFYIIFSITVLLCELNAVLVKDFFPFDGDNQLAQGSYQRSPKLQLDPPFLLLGQTFDTLAVVDNGAIVFGNDSATIAAYDAQTDTLREGSIYYKLSKSEVDLNRALDEIVAVFPMYQDLKLAYVVVATYIDVAPFNGNDPTEYDEYEKGNSFQMVIVGHQNISFAILNYGSINWFKPYTVPGSGYFLIGYNIIRHIRTWTGFGHLESMDLWRREDILNIDNMSNCRQSGKFIHRVDRDAIFGPEGLCAFPPEPANGFCKTTEYTPGSVAQCNCAHLDPKFHTEIQCSRNESNAQAGWSGDLPDCSSNKPQALTQTQTFTSNILPVVFVSCAIVLLALVLFGTTFLLCKRRNKANYQSVEHDCLQQYKNNCAESV